MWVLNKAGVKRELLDKVKARKLAYYGHTIKKQGSCLEKEIMQGTIPGARRRGRPRTAWMDNIKTWTGLSVEESIRMTEGRDKMEKVRPRSGQPSDRGRLKIRSDQTPHLGPGGLGPLGISRRHRGRSLLASLRHLHRGRRQRHGPTSGALCRARSESSARA